jgi:hypothetical protein
MPEAAVPADAEVAVLVGLHQKLGGPFKLVYVFRRLKCVQIFECVSHGRQWWYSLHLSTDHRYSLRGLQPDSRDLDEPYPEWWKRGAGHPYPCGVMTCLSGDVTGVEQENKSVVVVRDAGHEDNLSGGTEQFVPMRLLLGLIPETLLEQYMFWQDERAGPARAAALADQALNGGHRRGVDGDGDGDGDGDDRDAEEAALAAIEEACRGYRHLRGYPIDEEGGEFILSVEFSSSGFWEDVPSPDGMNAAGVVELAAANEGKWYNMDITGLPGRAVRVTRRLRTLVLQDFDDRQRIAAHLEQTGMLGAPDASSKRGAKLSKKEAEEKAKAEEKAEADLFQLGAKVEYDTTGDGANFSPCEIARINDDGTFTFGVGCGGGGGPANACLP